MGENSLKNEVADVIPSRARSDVEKLIIKPPFGIKRTNLYHVYAALIPIIFLFIHPIVWSCIRSYLFIKRV